MYNDEFEDLEQARQGPRRTYVSTVSSHDADQLQRENERLKKALEKEKFFNKLLDQELHDLKGANGERPEGFDPYGAPQKVVARSAFNVLLVISICMFAFIGYTLYTDKQYHLFGNARKPAQPVEPAPLVDVAEPRSAINSEAGPTMLSAGGSETATPKSFETERTSPVEPVKPAIRDSVPNIIGKNNAATKPKAAATPVPVEDYDEAELETELQDEPVTQQPVNDRRPVIGKYRVTSKANFYNSPDENTLRSTFISESPDKIVEALEDKNGFIFVIYTNDMGYTSRGWLSKKDLTKAD